MNHHLPLIQKLPDRSNLSRRDQICEMISATISAKAISPDIALPCCRQMADHLGVSRNTGFAAYSRLIDLGSIATRDRSGYYLNRESFTLPESSHAGQGGDEEVPSPVTFSPSSRIPLDNPLD